MSSTSDPAADAIKRAVYSGAADAQTGEDLLRGALLRALSAAEPLSGGAAGNARTLLTVVTHYALTATMIPSHRKVTVAGAEIDVVIPDVRTLRAEPGDALVLCIEPKDRGRAAAALSGAQPVAANVRAVTLGAAAGAGGAAYSAADGTLYGMIGDIRRFLDSTRRQSLGVVGAT